MVDLIAVLTNAPLKPTTLKPYLANLNTITRHCDGADLLDVIHDANTFFPMIERGVKSVHHERKSKSSPDKIVHGPEGTLRTLIKTLLALMKYAGIKELQPHYYMAWYSHFIDMSRILNQRADNNIPTSATEMTWKEITDRLALFEPGTIEHVTLALYTLIPPRRQQDYWKMLLKPPQAAPVAHTGFFDFSSPTMTVNAYKTSDKYETYVTTIPLELANTIQKYVANRKISSPFLFYKRNTGDAYSNLSSFTDANNKMLKRILNNPHVSVNSIRHAAATFVATDPHMTRGTKKWWARAMGHSLAMQGQYVVTEKAF
jgi:integrase